MADHEQTVCGNRWACCPECGHAIDKDDIAFAVEYHYVNSPLAHPSGLQLGDCANCGKTLEVTVVVHGRGER